MPLTLILFDIDGTLLDTSGAGRRSFALALEQTFGWGEDARSLTFAGATDLDLLERIAQRHGRTLGPAEVNDFFARLPGTLRTALATEPPHVYPGVRALLEALSNRPGVSLGLVTGNIESCAWVKLEACGLHGHFSLGAYGHEHADRRLIARLARQRAEQGLEAGQTFRASFLMGDTPSDVAAALAIGATAIAVATGGFEEARLREAGAHHVLATLQDTQSVLALLGLPPG